MPDIDRSGAARVRAYFAATPRLAELCNQNGWPDPETLAVEVVAQRPGELECNVAFEEVIMEGAGCIAGRLSCWGRYRLRLDPRGEVLDAELVAGSRG